MKKSISKYSAIATLGLFATGIVLAFQNCAAPLPSKSSQDKSSSSSTSGGLSVSPIGSCGPVVMPAYYDLSTITASAPNSGNNVVLNYQTATSAVTVKGNSGNDNLILSAYNDAAGGGSGDDYIAGAAGNDFIHGNQGNDTVVGGGGDDALYGGQGDDLIYGERGNDVIFGDTGVNILHGANPTYSGTNEDGDDTFYVTVPPSGSADISSTTIYDVGGANRLVCQMADGSSLIQGTARFDGNDLVIDFQGRADVRLTDYKLNPFACIECGVLKVK